MKNHQSHDGSSSGHHGYLCKFHADLSYSQKMYLKAENNLVVVLEKMAGELQSHWDLPLETMNVCEAFPITDEIFWF